MKLQSERGGMKKLIQLKKNYFDYLDRKARHLAHKLNKKEPSTKLLLDYISELYDSAKSEKSYKNEKFESAYHNPITSELEFLIARILYHYSNIKNLGWKVYLRRQVKKTAPDIRIEKSGNTIAVIEIKAKAGWIQPFFSSVREMRDLKKLKEKQSDYDPRELIAKTKAQLDKYIETFNIAKNQIFVFLPTLTLVHRKKYDRSLGDYENDFAKNSELKKENLVILSNNLTLDLSEQCKRSEYQPTDRFERFVEKIEKL